MKKIILCFLLIFNFNCGWAATSYECSLRELWEKIAYERGIDYPEGFFPHRPEAFLNEASWLLDRDDKALVFFYPKNSGFDQLVQNSAFSLELEEFFDLAEMHGFEIAYCSSRRVLASFTNREEMEDFVSSVLQTNLIKEVPLYFPSKVIIVELIKK